MSDNEPEALTYLTQEERERDARIAVEREQVEAWLESDPLELSNQLSRFFSPGATGSKSFERIFTEKPISTWVDLSSIPDAQLDEWDGESGHVHDGYLDERWGLELELSRTMRMTSPLKDGEGVVVDGVGWLTDTLATAMLISAEREFVGTQCHKVEDVYKVFEESLRSLPPTGYEESALQDFINSEGGSGLQDRVWTMRSKRTGGIRKLEVRLTPPRGWTPADCEHILSDEDKYATKVAMQARGLQVPEKWEDILPPGLNGGGYVYSDHSWSNHKGGEAEIPLDEVDRLMEEMM